MADRIIVVGSLNPEKEVQDRVRVLSGGYLPSDKGNRLQRSSESACGIYDPYNKALYKMICPTLLASDYKHLKWHIQHPHNCSKRQSGFRDLADNRNVGWRYSYQSSIQVCERVYRTRNDNHTGREKSVHVP